mgnify:FL=1
MEASLLSLVPFFLPREDTVNVDCGTFRDDVITCHTCQNQNGSEMRPVRNLVFPRTTVKGVKRMSSFAESKVQYISSTSGEPIAFQHTFGKLPGVIFLPGLMSTMSGTKATALEKYCEEIGHSYIRFDYRGHGMSGGKSHECTVGMRKEDVLTILDNVGEGKWC